MTSKPAPQRIRAILHELLEATSYLKAVAVVRVNGLTAQASARAPLGLLFIEMRRAANRLKRVV